MQMNNVKIFFLVAIIISVSSLITWQLTGAHAYTTYHFNETVQVELDPNDPLVQAGFYGDDKTKDSLVVSEGLHLGLLPTAQGIFDKHVFSVASISGPVWGLALVFWFFQRRKMKKGASDASGAPGTSDAPADPAV